MNVQGVKAQCRICGTFAPADQFKLHYKYKSVVCPSCFSGRKAQQEEKKVVVNEPPKPAGWDKEDEYLEKAQRVRQAEERSSFEKITGSDQVKCTCTSCKYVFKYDPFRKTPKVCPYCDVAVPRLKTFNML